jgi:hypothetical protein
VRKWLLIAFFVAIGVLILYAAILYWYWREMEVGFDEASLRALAYVGRSLPAVSRIPASAAEEDSTYALGLVGLTALEERMLALAVTKYYREQGALPRDISQAKPNGEAWTTTFPFERAMSNDPWGRPYLLKPLGKDRFLVISGGPSNAVSIEPEAEAALLRSPLSNVYRLGDMIVFVGPLNLQSSAAARVRWPKPASRP